MIYFIQSGEQGPIKIGYAANPYARLASLQTGNPDKLHIRLILNGKQKDELKYQDKFSSNRIRGEWYRPKNGLLDLITNYNKIDIDEDTIRDGISLKETMIEIESHFISTALKESDGNRSQAAKMLGITRKTLLSKIKTIKINTEMMVVTYP